MVDLSISPPVERERNAGFLPRISEFLALVGASVRAARAVEARRQPRPEDLAILGITTKLPTA